MKGRRVVCSLTPLSGIPDPRVPSVPKITVNDTTDSVKVLVERWWGWDWICKTRLVHGFRSRKVIVDIVIHSSRSLTVL